MTNRTRSLAALFPAAALFAAACGSSVTAPSPVTVTGTGVTTYTYTADVQPILASDCTRCHNPSQHEAGYDFTTYAAVIRAVSPGSASSPLVRETRPGRAMYDNLSGDKTHKAEVIYDWVVNSGARQ